MGVTASGIIYPDPADVPQRQDLQTLAETVQAAYGEGDDTGWVPLTPAGSFSGTIEIRKRNGIVFMRGNVTGTYSSGSVHTLVASGGVPIEMRPPQRQNVQLATNSAALTVRGLAENSGEIAAVTGPSAPNYVSLDGFTYLTD